MYPIFPLCCFTTNCLVKKICFTAINNRNSIMCQVYESLIWHDNISVKPLCQRRGRCVCGWNTLSQIHFCQVDRSIRDKWIASFQIEKMYAGTSQWTFCHTHIHCFKKCGVYGFNEEYNRIYSTWRILDYEYIYLYYLILHYFNEYSSKV